MKKLFFLLAMLAGVAASAQTLSIKITKMDYATKIATCDISWTGRNATHLSDVWVFVDYIEISGNAPAGSWQPAAITGATVTTKTTGNAAASTVVSNTRGVWVKSTVSGANFTGQVILQLSGVPAKFDACAYATDYPPNARALNRNNYTLHGTPPFVVNDVKLGSSVINYSGTITSLTDATGAPGIPGISLGGLGEQPTEAGCVAGLAISPDNVCVTPASVGCNNSTLNLGIVSFTAGTEVIITGNGISQIWSRPVTATGCQKTTYYGGPDNPYNTVDRFNADCRTAPGYAGDYFSWCAILHHADKLCPYPWRLPSVAEYIKLDIAMGGTGQKRVDAAFITNKYGGVWMSDLPGLVNSTNVINVPGRGWYAITQLSDKLNGSVNCRGQLDPSGNPAGTISFQETHTRGNGYIVRCIR
jgi:hypothetical protein